MSPQSAKRKGVNTRKRRLPVAEKEPVDTEAQTMACSETEMPSCSSQKMNNLDGPVGSKEEEICPEGSNDRVPVSRRKRQPKSSNGDPEDGEIALTCKLCPKTIFGNSEMTKHLKSHHPPEAGLICKVCSKKLSSRNSLDRHFLTHSCERPFKCPMCNKSFTTNGNLHRHQDKQNCNKNAHDKNDFVNKNAGKSIDNQELPSENHLNEASGAVSPSNGASSPPSGALIPSNGASSPPSGTLSPSNGALNPPCRAVSSTSEAISPPSRAVGQENENVKPNQSRKRSHTSESPPAKKTRAESSKPTETQTKPTETQVKPKLKGKTWKGPLPPLLFQFPFSLSKFPLLASTKEAQDTLPRKDTPLYRCARCHKAFLDLETLREHEASHMEMSIPDSDLVCPSCLVDHGSFCEFAIHRMSTTCEPEDPESSQSRFLKQFNLLENDQNGNSQVAEIIPSTNSQGEIYLNANSQLDVGNTNSQLEDERVDTDSQQEDQDPDEVADANSQVMEDSKRSPERSNDFADIGSILSNVSVSPEQSGLERLSQPQDAPRKSKRREKSTVYSCPEEGCSYSSPDKSGVKRHMMTHTKEHPFICKFREGEAFCGVEFTTKANAVRHAKKKHNLKEKLSLKRVIEFNSLSGVVIECPLGCPQVFYSEKARDHHLRAKFACTQKSFQCRICRQGFGTKNSYNRHFREKHRAGFSDDRFEKERVKNCIENKTRPKKGPRCTSSLEPAQSIQSVSVPERLGSYQAPAFPSIPLNGEEASSSNSGEDEQLDEMSEVMDSGIGSEEEPLDLSIHALDLRSNSFPLYIRSIERRYSLTDRSSMFERRPFSLFTSPILHRVPTTPPLAWPLDLSQRVPPCDFCGKPFSSQVSRDNHILKDHSGNDVFVATRVLQNFENIQLQLGDRRQPVASQEGNNSDTENVDLASVSSVIDTANSPFFSQYLSQSNWDTSTSQNVRSKENRKCASSFSSRNDLKRHQAVRTGKEEFECKVCGQSFSTKSNLTHHIKNIHENSRCLPSSGSSSLVSPSRMTTDNESLENSPDV